MCLRSSVVRGFKWNSQACSDQVGHGREGLYRTRFFGHKAALGGLVRGAGPRRAGQVPADGREQLGIAQGGFRAGSADRALVRSSLLARAS